MSKIILACILWIILIIWPIFELNPQPPKAKAQTTPPIYIGGVFSVAVSGSYLYMTSYNDITQTHSLIVCDLTNPAQPNPISSLPLPYLVSKIAISGNYLLATGSGFLVIDISNKLTPNIVGNLSNFYTNNFAVSGQYAYITTHGKPNQEYYIISFQDPRNPTIVQHLTNTPYNDAKIVGANLYLTSQTELKIFNIANPASPQLLGTSPNFNSEFLAAETGWIYGIKPTNIADVSNPTNVQTHLTDIRFDNIAPSQLAVQNHNIFFLGPSPSDYNNQSMQIFNWDPVNKSLNYHGIFNFDGDELGPEGSQIAASNDYLYVPLMYGLKVINVSNIDSPSLSYFLTDHVPFVAKFMDKNSANTWDATNANPGDILTYDVSWEIGDQAESSFVITDVVPSGTTYVANSAILSDAANGWSDKAMSDRNDGDGYNFNSTNNTITVSIGNQAPRDWGYFEFNVRVN